jgi:hypothetical protein
VNGTYQKIASTGWISRLLPGTRSGLYLGSDHLLHATQILLFEKYRRLYFADIEAITFCKSNRWIWFSAVWGFCLAASPLWYFGRTTWCYIAGAIFCLGFGVLLLSNLLAGPTYVVAVQTAAQLRRLKPLERERKLAKFQELVTPLILAAQQTHHTEMA